MYVEKVEGWKGSVRESVFLIVRYLPKAAWRSITKMRNISLSIALDKIDCERDVGKRRKHPANARAQGGATAILKSNLATRRLHCVPALASILGLGPPTATLRAGWKRACVIRDMHHLRVVQNMSPVLTFPAPVWSGKVACQCTAQSASYEKFLLNSLNLAPFYCSTL